MLMIVVLIALLLLVYGPNWWVRYVIRKHSRQLDGMPGTGGELARHLIERFELTDVQVKKTSEDEDYYSPAEKVVGLSPEVYDGKSIAAAAIAAHEVGHAIQYHRQEPVSRLRGRYTRVAAIAQNIGIFVLSCSPVLGLATRTPGIMMLLIIAGIVSMLASVVLHAMILPEEYDASFQKALPILQEGYLPEPYMPAARQVLKACAWTYVAAALSDVLSVWRWLSILR